MTHTSETRGSVSKTGVGSTTRVHEVSVRCLRAGDQFITHDTLVEVVRPPEPCKDFFDRDELKVWCRRLDTGAEGWVHYGLSMILESVTRP